MSVTARHRLIKRVRDFDTQIAQEPSFSDVILYRYELSRLVKIAVGKPITPETIATLRHDAQGMMDHLRARTYAVSGFRNPTVIAEVTTITVAVPSMSGRPPA